MIYGFIIVVAVGVATTSALPPCVCTRNYQPVCGSDGKTYDNQCMLECAKTKNADLTMARTGQCEKEQNTCICTFEYAPVCGADGQTYPNKCSLNCQQVRLVGTGPCPYTENQLLEQPKCVCTREGRPVCGSDGLTYANLCLLNCATTTNPRLSLKNYGPCVDEVKVVDQPTPDTCACARNMAPVCGSDGKTYANPCLLNCATAKNPALSVKSYGACVDEVKVVDQPITDTCACARNMVPVCGSDGNTYANPCLLNCATAKNPALSLKSYGPCVDEVKVVELSNLDSCACARNMRPVCGSDGKTYNNPCLLNCATKDNPSLSVARNGPCGGVNVVDGPRPASACTCTRELAPVCGSDGETYSSACIMRCRNPDATLVHDGPCES